MDVPLAIEVYRDLKTSAMIQRLTGIANIEERGLFAAELLVVLGTDLDKAKVVNQCLLWRRNVSHLGALFKQ